jgi:hypothetical protein
MSFADKIRAIRADAGAELASHGAALRAAAIPLAVAGAGTLVTGGVMASTVTIDPNIIDFANLSTMIGNVAGIIPGIVTLVVSTVPLFIVNGVVYLIMGIFGGVIAMFSFK